MGRKIEGVERRIERWGGKMRGGEEEWGVRKSNGGMEKK